MILQNQEMAPQRGAIAVGKGSHWGTLLPTTTYGQLLTSSANDSSGTGLNWATPASVSGMACPDAYGAAGNGIADDTAAINAAIATGLDVWLTPRKTYLTWGGHILGTGQVLMGNGATLYLANQVSQLCSATVNSGSSTLTVYSTTGLKVGQWIIVSNEPVSSAPVGGTNYDYQARMISAINGLTITTSTAWTTTVAGGTVYTTSAILTLGGTDGRVFDLVINGNMANQAWFQWWTTWGIVINNDRGRVVRCYLYNMPGEGIELIGSYPTVSDCVVNTANGNGYHLAANVEHPVVHGCRAIYCNQNTNNGHYMGGIGWSSNVQDATISNNYVYGCLSGMGAIDGTDNSDVTISNNTIRSCTNSGIFLFAATSSTAAGRVVITGNRIYACPIGINIQGVAYNSTVIPNRITLVANSFDLCTQYSIMIQYANYVTVSGNRFEMATGTTSIIHVYIVDSANIAISGNQFNGGNDGVYVYSAYALTQNVIVSGNVFSSQYSYGINFASANMPGVVAEGNTITNDLTASGSYQGIACGWGGMVVGNSLFLNNNGGALASLIGIQLNTSITSGGGTGHALNNLVRGTAKYGINSMGGSGGGCIFNNMTTSGAVLNIGGGTVTTPAVFGTVTISGGAIQTVPVTSGGTGYSGTPNLFAVGGGGSGATLTPVISGGVIQSVTVTAGGSGYTSPPLVVASGNFVANNQTVL